jgi:hypothetical protein
MIPGMALAAGFIGGVLLGLIFIESDTPRLASLHQTQDTRVE